MLSNRLHNNGGWREIDMKQAYKIASLIRSHDFCCPLYAHLWLMKAISESLRRGEPKGNHN